MFEMEWKCFYFLLASRLQHETKTKLKEFQSLLFLKQSGLCISGFKSLDAWVCHDLPYFRMEDSDSLEEMWRKGVTHNWQLTIGSPEITAHLLHKLSLEIETYRHPHPQWWTHVGIFRNSIPLIGEQLRSNPCNERKWKSHHLPIQKEAKLRKNHEHSNIVTTVPAIWRRRNFLNKIWRDRMLRNYPGSNLSKYDIFSSLPLNWQNYEDMIHLSHP